MQDYSNYDIKDFLADEAFCRWVLHQQAGDNAFWENWIRKNPDRATIVAAARDLVVEIQHAQNYLSDEELRHELTRLSEARKAETPETEYAETENTWFGKLTVFMVIMACAMVLYHFYPGQKQLTNGYTDFKSLKNEQKKLVEIVNNGTVIKTILLQDGSRIRLSPDSRISYPDSFVKKEREVFLSGEAFFEVTKNPNSPFKVYTSEIVTTVLGTSFTVKAFEKDRDVSVVVKTGKVTVATAPGPNAEQKNEADELVLLPNQQMVYYREEQKMKRSLVENPAPVGPVEIVSQNLIFDRAPVASVFDALQKRYEVQIVYDADLLAGCQLTAELGQEPLFEKLGMICKAIQARYELIDGQIIIYGTSCK